jgi:hypothetical protein
MTTMLSRPEMGRLVALARDRGCAMRERVSAMEQLAEDAPSAMVRRSAATALRLDYVCECGHASSEHAEPMPHLSNPCRAEGCQCNGFNYAAQGWDGV